MQYLPYVNYVKTKISWISQYPANWEIRRLKFMSSIQNGSDYKHVEVTEGEDGYPVYGSGGAFRKASEYLFDGESVLYGRKGTIDKPLYVNGKFWTVDTMFYSIIDESVFGRFMYYGALTIQYQFLATQTALPSITQNELSNYWMCYPGYEEQTQIAKFLDHKTQQIDRLIDKKKALIEKLNEQRIALITQAVSKGLNPDAPMKDSGVDWLGEIPAHWETRRLKLLATEPLKYGANEAAELTDRNFPRYIRITDVMGDGNLDESTFRSLEPNTAKPYLLYDGDILLARSGATVGKSFLYKQNWGEAAYAGYLIRFRTQSSDISESFAYHFLNSASYWANINSTLIQSTIQNFNAEKYGNIVIPLPSLEEQQTIEKYLSRSLAKIDRLQEKIKNATCRLEEYRSALITAAVTGKIDVRNIDIPELDS